ncbi:MAG: hypothetical protein ACK5PP_12395, partial [Acidimicrobiales bacterium]
AAMGAPWTMEQVRLAVSVRPRGQSNVIEIEATTLGADEASRLATTYATESVGLRNADVQTRATELLAAHERAQATGTPANALDPALVELRLLMEQGDPSLSVITPAPVPDGPVTPSPRTVMVLAALIGLLGGVALAVAVDGVVASLSTDRSADRIPPRHRSTSSEPGPGRPAVSHPGHQPTAAGNGVRSGIAPGSVTAAARPGPPAGLDHPSPAAAPRVPSWDDEPIARSNGWATNGGRGAPPRGGEGSGW